MDAVIEVYAFDRTVCFLGEVSAELGDHTRGIKVKAVLICRAQKLTSSSRHQTLRAFSWSIFVTSQLCL
jgi:hypothetical protein